MAAPREYFHGKGGFISKTKFMRKLIFKCNEKEVKELPTTPKDNNVHGRRVIDIQFTANQLWCNICDETLSLRNIISETVCGLASVFRVFCTKCKLVHEVKTSTSKPGRYGRHPTYDVNLKIAMGILDCGIGPIQLNTLLSAANIPPVSDTLLKRHERKVGPVIEEMATQSCKTMIQVEKEMTQLSGDGRMVDSQPVIESAVKNLLAYSRKQRQTVIVCPKSVQPESTNVEPNIEEDGRPTVIVEASAVPTSESSHSAGQTTSTRAATDITPKRKLQTEDVDEDVRMEIKKVRLTASYDMGWQCRGNGKTYNSQSGHGALMGHHSKKVLSYATRITSCRLCSIGNTQHDCRRNFDKSAKAMEADLALSFVTDNPLLDEGNVEVGTIIGDEDSSTMAKIRSVRPDIEKWSDLNHIKKGYNNSLYLLQKKHKVLTTKVIKYFKTCFSYAVTQNKGDVAGLKEALLNIVEHAFDKHVNCKEWCRHRLDPSAKFQSLPRGECLKGDGLYHDLKANMDKYVSVANRISPCGSTQANESFNAVVASKAPKAKFYSGSESLNFRLACAVNKTNIGTQYVLPVNKKLNLSPGIHTAKHRKRVDSTRYKAKVRKSLLFTKKRRLALRNQRKNGVKLLERKEGTTYESGMGLLQENNSTVEVVSLEHILQSPSDNKEYVYFDLETTGLGAGANVIQIAALHGEAVYNSYILPVSIPEKVSEITGLTLQQKSLYLHGERVKTVSKQDAWSGYVNFLAVIQKKIILVGHNIGFDLRFLLKECKHLNLCSHLEVLVSDVLDTLKVCRSAFPGRKSYKQSDIACNLAVAVGTAHNAVSDILTLQAICRKIPLLTMEKHLMSFGVYCNRKLVAADVKKRKLALQPLKDVGVSAQMISKIVAADVSLDMLHFEYLNGRNEGIETLLFEKVTKNKKIVDLIISYLQSVE